MKKFFNILCLATLSASSLFAQRGQDGRQEGGNSLRSPGYQRPVQESNSGVSDGYYYGAGEWILIGPSGRTYQLIDGARLSERDGDAFQREVGQYPDRQVVIRTPNGVSIIFLSGQWICCYIFGKARCCEGGDLVAKASLIDRLEGQSVTYTLPNGRQIVGKVVNGKISLNRKDRQAVASALQEGQGDLRISFSDGTVIAGPTHGFVVDGTEPWGVNHHYPWWDLLSMLIAL